MATSPFVNSELPLWSRVTLGGGATLCSQIMSARNCIASDDSSMYSGVPMSQRGGASCATSPPACQIHGNSWPSHVSNRKPQSSPRVVAFAAARNSAHVQPAFG